MVSTPRIGDVISGKYRVERVLGRGGMGVVVAARHLRLRERVAIKFLVPRSGAGGDAVARFVREGRAAMRIRSEHVVRVYDVGTRETGESYLVMEYLEGRDLAAVLKADGPLPVEATLEHVLQAVEAIAEAHARGIVHRDIKPSNLFLTRRADGSPMVKVLDFGIAKSTDLDPTAGGPTDSAPTGALGTPAYMAPEQMRSARAVDTRTDIWALGATLHALLTGAPPFSAGSLVEMHERTLRGPPPLRAARPDAPEALEAILLRCMAPDPADRYASVADLAEALAPLAPEHARISAQRAARILAAGPLDAEPSGGPADEEPGSPSAETPPVTDAAADPSWVDGTVAGTTTGWRTGASPPEATAAPPRPRTTWRRPRTLAAIGLMATSVVLVALAMGRRNHTPEPAPVSSAAQPAALPAPAPPPADRSASEDGGAQRAPAVSASSAGPAPAADRERATPNKRLPAAPAHRRDPLADPD
jgi:serine/threonine-protein kinase